MAAETVARRAAESFVLVFTIELPYYIKFQPLIVNGIVFNIPYNDQFKALV
jgi:hypothetical protein